MAKQIPAENSPIVEHRGERILAFMIASAIGLSIICFIAIIVGTAAGAEPQRGIGAWPIVFVLPLIGLPLGAALMIALIVVSGLRRGREARDASK